MTRTMADLPSPKGLPIIGNAHQLVFDTKRMHQPMEKWGRELGPMFRIDLGPKRAVLVTSDPEIVADVLRRRPDEFRRSGNLAKLAGELFGIDTGLFFAEGAEWKHQRAFVMAALNTKHLKRYFSVVNRTGGRMHERLHRLAASGESINVGREFNLYAVDVATSLAFGQDLNTVGKGDNEFRRLYESVLDRVVARLLMPVPYWRVKALRLPVDRKAQRDAAIIIASLRGWLEEGRQRLRDNPDLFEHPETPLDAMIAEQMTTGAFSDDDIVGNMSTLLFAGQDSIAQTLAWTFWLVSANPRVQQRLRDEADEVLGEHPFPTDIDMSSKLEYADAVLRESMRLRTVSPAFAADAIVDTYVGDVFVPKGTEIGLLGRLATSIDAPDQADFRPERWLEEGPKLPKTLTFGSGPRYCPGRNLALAEARGALAMMSRDFDLRLDPSAPPVTEKLHFAMSPSEVRVFLTPRARVSRKEAAAQVA